MPIFLAVRTAESWNAVGVVAFVALVVALAALVAHLVDRLER